MRILFVAKANSVHTARWLAQLPALNADIHLFPVESELGLHPDIRDITVYDMQVPSAAGDDGSIRYQHRFFPVTSSPLPLRRWHWRAERLVQRVHRDWMDRAWRLSRIINKLKPDVVQSMEIQGAGYLTLEARRHLGSEFPVWLQSIWGNDIYLFGRLEAHRERVAAVLGACDWIATDCVRDVDLARSHGFAGKAFPVLPAGGGLDLDDANRLRVHEPPSSRRVVLLKGYQSIFGRALVGLRAIELCADALKGYRIIIYLASEPVKVAAELLARQTGLIIETPPVMAHRDLLGLQARARVSMGLSISDGAPNTMLEAMLMGAFPVQSSTSCADEWVTCGESALLVDPNDPVDVAAALTRALTDDALVNAAADRNAAIARTRLSSDVVRPQVLDAYRRMLAGT